MKNVRCFRCKLIILIGKNNKWIVFKIEFFLRLGLMLERMSLWWMSLKLLLFMWFEW